MPRKIIDPEKSPIEEEEDCKEPISDKSSSSLGDLPGVGPATIEKLDMVGFRDVMAVAVATPGELIEATGMSLPAVKKLIAAARASLDMGFVSGEDMLKKRMEVIKITSQSKCLNELIGGGFETGVISELYGMYGSSKTQIAHQLAVSVQLPKEKGGAEGMAVYIDTENTFRPERIQQIALGLGLDPSMVLKNIKVARAFNSDHQMLLAEKVDDLIKQPGNNIRLLIVDSLTAHFRAEFIGRGTLAERQQKLNKHMRALAKVAVINNVCVLVTNQVMAKPDQFFGDPTEAIGGHIVGHNSCFRIYLRKGKKGCRVAKLVDSPHLPEGEAIFVVTNEGIRDA